MLHIRGTLLDDTFRALRACGRGARECVAYWTGPVVEPGTVDAVVQPPHRASRRGYMVDDDWVTAFFLELRRARRSIRAQIHTHPGSHVRHSRTDDAFAIAPSPGFTSIVLPFFATGPITLADAYITVLGTDGSWYEHSHDEAFGWE